MRRATWLITCLLLGLVGCASGFQAARPPIEVRQLKAEVWIVSDPGLRATMCNGNSAGCFWPYAKVIICPPLRSWNDAFAQAVLGHEAWHALGYSH